MRVVVALTAGLSICAGSALAADLPPGPPPPQAPAYYKPAPTFYNWSGVYVGINGGYGFGSTNNWTGALGGSTGNFSTNGALAGGTLGFNYQTGPFVFGIEGDGDWSDIQGSSAGGCGTLGAGIGVVIPATVSCKTANTWLATGRGRVGYAFDRLLLYGTGGGAFGNVTASTPGSAFGSNSNTEFGWTAGAGIE